MEAFMRPDNAWAGPPAGRPKIHNGEGEVMRGLKLLRGLLAGSVLLMLIASAAFAKDSRSFRIDEAVSIQGTQIKPGQYKISWETHSPDTAVTLARGRKVIATATGKLVDRGTTYKQNVMLYEIKADGSREIIEFRIRGTNQALVFNE
jgi:hypothetical protein